LSAAKNRLNLTGIPQRTIKVPLPPNWEAIPGEDRTYRRRGVNGGRLRISLAPAHPERSDASVVLDRLREMLADTGQDVGEELTSARGSCPLGPLATSLRRSAERGLLQFWLVAGEVTVFASYIMGDLDAAQQDLAEAQQVMIAIQFEEGR